MLLMRRKKMTRHELKIKSEFYHAVKNGIKRCEIRRNDRDFKVGDDIKLTCANEIPLVLMITHILTDEEFSEGLKKGYCAISFERLYDSE